MASSRGFNAPLDYASFRTGLSYRDVYQMLWVHSDDSRDWKYKRRGTVLGLWRSIKLGLWDRYLAELDGEQQRRAVGGGAER